MKTDESVLTVQVQITLRNRRWCELEEFESLIRNTAWSKEIP